MNNTITSRTCTALITALFLSLSICPAASADASAPQIQSLDGTWQIIFDPENLGRSQNLHKNQPFQANPDRRPIGVPSCWELTEKDYEGVAFYRRTFDVPQSWQGKIVRLHFDAVNFRAEVWVNDHAAGVHEGGFTPFEFRVDSLLKPGQTNTLILRVAGPILMQDKTIDGVGKMQTPQWRGAITGGIWQSVRLIATDDIYVDDVFIKSDISDNIARFEVQLDHAGTRTIPTRLELTVRSAAKPDKILGHFQPAHKIVARSKCSLDMNPGPNKFTFTLDIPDARYWSPADPHLYLADLTVTAAGTVSDRWTARFGMRHFTIRDKRFYLNGQPMYLKATFFEGLYPTKLAYPDSREMAVREITLAKEAGFNMIRPWRKPPSPMWLDLCDEIGVLTVGSMVIECMDFPFESAALPGWVENEVTQSILRDRNRTCVVQWELFNELKRPVLKQMLGPMSVLARQLDPTRLILDESGGWAQGANIFLPYESTPTKFNDIHDYPGPQVNDEVFTKLILTGSKTHDQMRQMGLSGRLPGRNVIPHLMTVFSELGYGSLPNLPENNKQFEKLGSPIAPPTVYHRRLADEHSRVLAESGFDRVYPDLADFCLDQQILHGTANKRMIEAVRCNPEVKGYCIHALTAGDWIMGAGLLDLFRNPKTYAYHATKAANQHRILVILMRPRNVYAEKGTAIEITAVNELQPVEGALKLTVSAADGRAVLTKTATVKVRSGITKLLEWKLDTRSLRGPHTAAVQVVTPDGKLIAANEYTFDVFTEDQLTIAPTKIALHDPAALLKPFLKKSRIEFVDFDSETDRSLPVFVARTEAKTKDQRAVFTQLKQFVESGGTVVYLRAGGDKAPWALPGTVPDLLPVKTRIKASIGLWLAIPHIVTDHPVFEGLPVDCMMGPTYENVWATHTLFDTKVKPIAGAVGFDFAPDFVLETRHYYGPGDTWWGADLAEVPHGKGRAILSQLRLANNLSKDPVADKILLNLIKWTTD